MWNDLSLAHEGPPDTTDTKIEALRLKFNAFKAFEGEKVNGTFTRLKCLLNDLENNGVSILQAEINATFVNNLPRKWLKGLIDQIHESKTSRFTIQASSSKALISNSQLQDSDSDVEEDQRSSSEFLADLNAEFHERALLVNQKRVKYKGPKAEIAILRKKIYVMSKGKSEKWLDVESFNWDKELVSFEDEGITKVKAFMAIIKDESFVGKADARSGQWVEIIMKKTSSKVTLDQLLTDQFPGNIVPTLGRRGKRKETISSKEIVFTKADESPAETTPEITSDSESEYDEQEPLPLLPKLSRAEPIGTSSDVLTLADLTQTPAVSKEFKKVTDKNTADKASKKKALTVSPFVPNPIPIKKDDSPTEQLLLTLMEKVKGLKEQIKTPSDNYPSVSQIGSSKSSKGKQKTWFGPMSFSVAYESFGHFETAEEFLKEGDNSSGIVRW
ncbi:hypothetical protein Tco_1361648 [Tanacetum coccineum]